MNPFSSSSSNLATLNQTWPGAVIVLGLLFLGVSLLLLLLCASSSSSGRKKRQRIGDGGKTDLRHSNGSDVMAQDRKWRESPTKKDSSKWKRKKTATGTKAAEEFPVITIIVTPPTPCPEPRTLPPSEDDIDSNASIGSSGDLATHNTASDDVTTTQNDDSPDVTRGQDDDATPSPFPAEADPKTKMACSTTSLSGIGDVNFVTSEDLSSATERGGHLEEGEGKEGEEEEEVMCEPRPRLPSMEPGSCRADYRIIVVDKCKEIKS